MPLRRNRADGELVRDLPAERRIMPHLMRGRNESAVYHEDVYDITRTRQWLRRYNRAREGGASTCFHLFLWACAWSLHYRPQVNRFVVGRRIYQRNHVALSFAAKRSMDRDAPLVTVKVPFSDPEEPFPQVATRIASAIGEGRTSDRRRVDRELRLIARLPHFLVALIMWFYGLLDRLNLLPRSMIDDDPMYTSLFVTNLGSIGINDTYHHLYEVGTGSLFAVLGTQKKTLFVNRRGTSEVKDGLQVRWTFDERVTDGMASGRAFMAVKNIVEDPERYLGSPEVAAAGARPAPVREAA